MCVSIMYISHTHQDLLPLKQVVILRCVCVVRTCSTKSHCHDITVFIFSRLRYVWLEAMATIPIKNKFGLGHFNPKIDPYTTLACKLIIMFGLGTPVYHKFSNKSQLSNNSWGFA